MASLDPVIQEVLLQGDGEIISALQEIGEKGAEAFKALQEAAEAGSGGLNLIAEAALSVEGAISAAVVGLVAFAEAQDEATQRTAFLADAMRTTASTVNGLEDAFAAAGVASSTAERLLQRLTTTIAQQWPSISASIRTSSTQQSEAQEAVVSSTLRVKAAQDALAFGAEDDGQKIEASNLRVAQTFRNLQNTIQDGAAAMRRSYNSVADAGLAVEAAQQRLSTLQGNGPSADEQKALQVRQAEQALADARQAENDKRIAASRAAQEQEEKEAQARQAHAAAQLANEKDLAQLESAQLQRTNALAEAEDRKASAIEKAAQLQLTSIPTITTALQGVVDKNADVAKSIDLNDVSVGNLTKGIINLASVANGGIKPTGLQAFNELVTVLSHSTDEVISKDQQLAIVQQLVSRGMGVGAIAAADLLAAIQHGPQYFQNYIDAANQHISTQEKGIEAAEEFKKSLESFQQQLQLTNRDLAALASPALVSFFNQLKASLTSADGTLHLFIDGLKALGAGIGEIGNAFVAVGEMIDKAFNLGPGRGLQLLIGGLIIAVAAFASAWVGIPAVIAVVVTAVGFIVDHLKEVSQWAEDNRAKFIAVSVIIAGLAAFFAPWLTAMTLVVVGITAIYENWDKLKAALTDNSVTRFWERFLDLATKIKNVLSGAGWTGASATAPGASASSNPGSQSTNQAANAAVQNVGNVAGASGNPDGLKFSGGGDVNGPGTQTSDSIIARLSRGEFVMKAQAVQQFGSNFMHAINNGFIPGFATGGLVPSPVRMAGGGAMPATSTLNLSIGGRSFNGLRGPKSTIDDLTSFAISRQTSAAGENPSWMK